MAAPNPFSRGDNSQLRPLASVHDNCHYRKCCPGLGKGQMSGAIASLLALCRDTVLQEMNLLSTISCIWTIFLTLATAAGQEQPVAARMPPRRCE